MSPAGSGECLVDDVEASRAGSTNVVNNGDFEGGTTGWYSAETTAPRRWTPPAQPGHALSACPRPSDGDTGPNTLRNTLRATLPNNQTVTLRAKVRWLAGWPQVLFRLHGNGLELAANFEIPRNLGTPGLPNSRRAANAGPAISNVTHDPPLPAANEAVLVTCRITDPDGVGPVQLRYRADPATAVTTLSMRDDGTLGDELAGDGSSRRCFRDGRPALVAFRITAADAAGQPASTTFLGRFTEAGAPGQECLVRWGHRTLGTSHIPPLVHPGRARRVRTP
jgi:hypothetical protein